jgi:hypothetical protein
VAFLRIVRDKRGYEYFSLVQEMSGRRGKVRQRVLYWYRTPPNIKVGRGPLDQEAVRLLEAQNPDVQFDWDALRDTPPPVLLTEPWRERRRAERAARQFRETDAEPEVAEVDPEPAALDVSIETEPVTYRTTVESATLVVDIVEVIPIVPEGAAPEPEAAPAAAGASPGRRRRHRRRGRGSRPESAPDGSTPPSLPTSLPAERAAPSSTDSAPPDDHEE